MTFDTASPLPCSWRKLIVMCAVSFVLVAAAGTMDARIAEAVHRSSIHPRMHQPPAEVIKSLGVYYWFTIPAAIIVGLFHRFRWRGAVFVLMTGLVCLLGNLLKWTIGRNRPFHFEQSPDKAVPFRIDPFHHGWKGLVTQTNLAFPSGHTMVAFATATALAILWPRWR